MTRLRWLSFPRADLTPETSWSFSRNCDRARYRRRKRVTNVAPFSAAVEHHPFHIHVNGFSVVDHGAFDPATGTILTRMTADPRGEMDTLNIAPGQWARIRIRFADYVGRTVFHCHVLGHEDLGMMGVIDIVDADGNGVGVGQLLLTQTGHSH